MKALVLDQEKVLSIKELDKPTLAKGQVLISIKAASLNHREIWITKGLYPGMTLPCTLGADGAGVIESIGEDVNDDWLGKEVIIYPAYDWGEDEQAPNRSFRVLGMPDPGTMAAFISVPIDNVVIKPKYLSWEEAAAIPIAGLTAWRALMTHGGMKAGHRVLITGIGGGVAQAGLAFANAIGAESYVTSSSQEKIDRAIGMGAKGGVNYKEENWNLALKEISGGIDIVLDGSPSAVLDDYFKFMNYGGRIITYGSTGSRKTTINISKFFLRHIQFIGTAMGSPREFQRMINFMEENEIRPTIEKVFPFDEAKESFASLESGQQVGKMVIRISE